MFMKRSSVFRKRSSERTVNLGPIVSLTVFLMVPLVFSACGVGASKYTTRPVEGLPNASVQDVSLVASKALEWMGYGIAERSPGGESITARKRVVEDHFGRSTEMKIQVLLGPGGAKFLGVNASTCPGCLAQATFDPDWMTHQFFQHFDMAVRDPGRYLWMPTAGPPPAPSPLVPPPGSVPVDPFKAVPPEQDLEVARAVARRAAHLGIELMPVTPELAAFLGLAEPKGAAVQNAVPDSPAAKAGLKKGDVILEADRQPVEGPRDVVIAVSNKSPGDPLVLRIWRDGAVSEKTVALAALPRAAESPTAQGAAGRVVGSQDPSPAGKQTRTASPPRPALQITAMEVKPDTVRAGSKFNLVLEYTVADPTTEEKEIPVQFAFSIVQGSESLYSPKGVEIKSSNGGVTKRIEPVTAGKKPGSYTIKATLTFRGASAQESRSFRIE